MTTHDTTIAAQLIAAGEVVVAAIPNPHFDPAAPSGQPEAREYLLPKAWQHLDGDTGAISAWQPGWALLLVCSRHLAVVDIDTKHGADRDTEVARLTALGVPILGEARTPSGGAHIYVPATGLASTNNPARGIDTRGQAFDGSGTGFVYLPGTQRPKYDGGGYEWVKVPDPVEAADNATDDTFDAMAAYLLAIGSTPRTRDQHTEVANGEPLPDNVPSLLTAMLADLGPTWYFASVDKRLDDRSRRFHRLVAECHYLGLTQGQTVTALDRWCHSVGKYANRVATEVARSWKRIDNATQGGAA